jgi:2-enoate reductase
VGDHVVVVGGGFMGCETALYIAEALKKKVTILEMLGNVLFDNPEPTSTMSINKRLLQAKVEVKTSLVLKGYSGKKVICTDKEGKEHQMDADSVVLATGLQPRQDMATKFKGLVSQTFTIGDCVQPRKIYHAFEEAWKAVLSF